MPTLKVVYKASTKEARVLDSGAATPSGFTAVGTFVHPDATYPDSVVIYHGVRDLLYKRSAANPANTAMFPDNITNMQEISITNLAVAEYCVAAYIGHLRVALFFVCGCYSYLGDKP